VIVRRELPEDRAAVDAVTSAAFGPAGDDAQEPVETSLLRALRADVGWIPTLSLVAVADDEIFAHVVCTRGRIGRLDVLGLGPISVLPPRQRRGAGEALMHAVIGAADAAGEPLIGLVGEPRFYARFGFVPASELGVVAPDPAWGDYFQVRTLTDCPPAIAGVFQYAAPFADM
jgi:putative acetyltransferase